ELPGDRSRGKGADQQPSIIGKDPNVGKVTMVDIRQQLDDAVFEHFTSDEADLWVSLGLEHQMLTPAKPDLQPNLSTDGVKQCPGIEKAPFRNGSREPRRRGAQPSPLSGAKHSAVSAPI